jgi:hypothetical protein
MPPDEQLKRPGLARSQPPALLFKVASTETKNYDYNFASLEWLSCAKLGRNTRAIFAFGQAIRFFVIGIIRKESAIITS